MGLPTDYANLTAWWKADAGYYNSYPTLATDGQAVSRWDDQSGNGRNLTLYSSGGYPTWRQNILNGLPVLRTSAAGSTDFYSSTYTKDVLLGTDGTAFSVFRPIGSTDIECWIFWNGTNGTERSCWRGWSGGSYPGKVFCYNRASWAGPAATASSGFSLATWMRDSTYVYAGNLDTRTASLATAPAGSTTNGNFYLRTAGYFQDMEVAEMVFYSRALSEGERMGVEAYLASKYALTIPYGGGGFVVLS